jgi:putative addiction module component (TIGR02574 family)
MTTKTKKLLEDALKLPREERADLAAQLWNSLDEQDWLSEVENRVDELKSRRVKGIPLERAFEKLRKRHGVSRKR